MYNEDDNSLRNEDNFKEKFKYYKANKPKPSLVEILSVEVGSVDKVINITPNIVKEDPRTDLLGLQKQAKWRTFTLHDHPGLIIIRNPFTTAGQRYWIRKCLEVYPRKPHKRNIDIETDIEDWWAECFENDTCNRLLQKKLRWTTLGYHHNWDTKVYSEENKAEFPADLAELSDIVAQYLGYTSFKAEAAIVNYYHMDSTLSAHTDHSEVNLEAPLLSFSFGQSAIFLIGGKEKSKDPSAILLQSGDIAIMSKEARLCYHAVPKILPSSNAPWDDQELASTIICDNNNLKYMKHQDEIVSLMNKNMDNSEWSRFKEYIEQSRINMNVRQVLKEKQKSLCDRLV
ncbi:nucleic acid dioxygenase ALKBH1 [Pectinophora gossypiella]|uniref:nucleic acid dioxygenase ALKBH1 n=1 Tax=Pectinophora gossypiella TaxID=13191 RepID=UPI00214DFE69|nr:nucleic acid dioxygenase ALKBH1 [Pectinophora gossypiella]